MKNLTEINYRFCKTQTVEIDTKKEGVRVIELSHFEKDTFFSVLLKGKVSLVTMAYYSPKHKKITRFYVFAKYPNQEKYEFLKSYRSADRARILFGGVK